MSVTLEDAGDDPQLEPGPGRTPLWPHLRVRALYEHSIDPDRVRAVLPGAPAVKNVQVREIADRDWLAASSEDIGPIEIGGPCWATPPPERTIVRLEPGLAFGSGRHPTTRLCLERLVATPPVGIDVIDYGCGSGILAIAAAVLGAHRVTALDIDPQARQATVENARINGVSDRVKVVAEGAATGATADVAGGSIAGAVTSAAAAPASLVIANILAGPLVELAPVLAAMTAPGGDLALSGILEAQADEIAGAYRDAFDIHTRTSSDGWVRLDGRRRIG